MTSTAASRQPITAETVITGHSNADFDCLAAIIAAGKLYSNAVLVFPGSQEKPLRNFFIQSATYMFNFVAAKDIDVDSVKRLVVVDTRQRSRLEHVSRILAKPDLEIHVYDHHPDSDEDLPADQSVVEMLGSTTTILTREIERRGLSLTAEEATVLGLGIYEDTGSFAFNSTTPEDLMAAAWLRSQGMDLDVLSELLTRELTAEQVAILNELLENATTHDVGGVEVVITQASSEHYVGDFAFLVHKMMDMEAIRVLFALGRMQDRITLVGRSRSPDVDVGRICEHFGGGGHTYAASASIKDRTLMEVREELFALLYSHVHPQMRVQRFMSSPAITIANTRTIREASELMTRYGLKAVPVVSGAGDVRGIIEHQIADKAISHGLEDVEVREYMARDVTVLDPEADLFAAMEIILGQRQRLVPVVQNGRLQGVLTRTDLINILVEEPARIPESLLPERKREKNIATLMRERLPVDILELLRDAGRLARDLGWQVYVVGGFVRDLLLGIKNLDVDLVVEGDGIAYATALAERLGGRLKAHQKFKTAVVILPDDTRVDVATARLEYYEYPAALPTVELSSIKMDLFRRDFTINALAVHINPDSFGRVVDFFGGHRDIKERTIRVLHSLSFVEDPTRILRAIRFEHRYDFKIGGQTERLIKNALHLRFFDKLSGGRVFHELKLIFAEEDVAGILERMEQFKLLSRLHPALQLTSHMSELVSRCETVLDWYRLLYLDPEPQPWKVYLLALCQTLKPEQVHELASRLGISKHEAEAFFALRWSCLEVFGQVMAWQKRHGPVSELYFLLQTVPLEGQLFLMARSVREPLRKSISSYLTRLRQVRLEIGGADLKALGLAPGPPFGEILRQVLALKLDARVEGHAQELAAAARVAKDMDLEPRMPESGRDACA